MMEDQIICLQGACTDTEDEVTISTDTWNPWVRPAICVSIVLAAVVFFAFMYFGRSCLEGSAKVVCNVM